MSGRKQNSRTPLGNWLRKHGITITQFAEDVDIAYRTAWLAAHSARAVKYHIAKKIIKYVGKVPKITIDSLCEPK